jgi:WD40 repeat protein
MTTKTTNPRRVQWIFIGLLGCWVALTGCRLEGAPQGVPQGAPPPPNDGVTCLVEGLNITANASGDPDKIFNYISQDGGMTWNKPASDEVKNDGSCEKQSETWQLWATVDGKIRYRFMPNTSIERSEDGGETWKREVDLTDEGLKPKTPTKYAKNYGPLDAMVHFPTGNVVVAMGLLGILLRTPDAQWQWIRVGNYYRGDLAALKTPVPRAANPVPQPTPVPADRVLKGNSTHTCGIAFSRDGKTLVATANGVVSLWRTEDWSPLATVGKLGNGFQGFALSPDGSIVATAGVNVVQLWSAPAGNALQRLELTGKAPAWDHSNQLRVDTYAFSPDGASLATGATNSTVQLWSVEDGTLLRTINADMDGTSLQNGQLVNSVGGGIATSLAFSPEGLLLAANTASRKILVWRIADGKLLYTFERGFQLPANSGQSVNASLTFSTDGQMLLAVEGDTSLRVWRMTDGSLARMLMLPLPHGTLVSSAAFSSDRQILATGSPDGTVRLWRAADATLMRRFTSKPDSGSIADLAFSPDNQTLAAVAKYGTARVWFLSP